MYGAIGEVTERETSTDGQLACARHMSDPLPMLEAWRTAAGHGGMATQGILEIRTKSPAPRDSHLRGRMTLYITRDNDWQLSHRISLFFFSIAAPSNRTFCPYENLLNLHSPIWWPRILKMRPS